MMSRQSTARDGGRERNARGDDGASNQFASGYGAGKVILCGEHAVLYQQPALVAVLERGLRARVRAGTGCLSGPELGINAQIGDDSPLSAAAKVICARLGAARLDVDLDGDLPLGNGLGGSAALCVAVARAVGGLRGAARAEVEVAAACGEQIFHGRSSGVDVAAAFRAGVGTYTIADGWQELRMPQATELCVGLSGVQRSTRDQVDAIAARRLSDPSARRLIEELGQLSRCACRALLEGDPVRLGAAFNDAHDRLVRLALSCAEVERLVALAHSAGALGAKLTGAGGGGAVIALGHDNRRILQAWREAGYQCFATSIAAK